MRVVCLLHGTIRQRTANRTRGDPIPAIVGRAAVLYGILLLVSVVWISLRNLGFSISSLPIAMSFGLGVGCAALTFLSGYAGYALIPAVRRLADEMSALFSRVTTRTGLVLIAIASGVGEEVFFRATLQEEFGLVIASVVFGIAHIGPDRRYFLWTFWALAAGFLFGGLYISTGGIFAPIVAHVLHNAVTLLYWQKRSVGGKSNVIANSP